MLARLKFNIEVLVNEILDRYPAHVWTDNKSKFIDPAIGGGQFVAAIERRLRENGCTNENIRSRVFGYESNQMRLNYAVNKYGLIGTYIVGEIEELKALKMNFDAVVSNPPWNRTLHLRFLTLCQKLLAPGGCGVMVHPASWIMNKYSNQEDVLNAQNMMNECGISLEFRDQMECFPEIDTCLDVSITMFGAEKRNTPIYVKNEINKKYAYYAESVDSITKYGTKYEVYKRILDKIATGKHDFLKDHLSTPGKYYICFPSRTGGSSTMLNPNSYFYAMIPKKFVDTVHLAPLDGAHSFGFKEEHEARNFLKYTKTRFARFCLSIIKFDQNIPGKSLSLIPWMDFSQEWDDNKLL